MKKVLLLLLAITFLVACGKKSYPKYIGKFDEQKQLYDTNKI